MEINQAFKEPQSLQRKFHEIMFKTLELLLLQGEIIAESSIIYSQIEEMVQQIILIDRLR